jgi:hypothetical protein
MPVQRYPSAARIATFAGDAVNRLNHKGVKATLDVTAVPGVDTVSLVLEEDISPTSTPSWRQLGACAARVAIGQDSLTVYPDIAAVANVAISAYPHDRIRARVLHSAGTSFTYGLIVETLP